MSKYIAKIDWYNTVRSIKIIESATCFLIEENSLLLLISECKYIPQAKIDIAIGQLIHPGEVHGPNDAKARKNKITIRGKNKTFIFEDLELKLTYGLSFRKLVNAMPVILLIHNAMAKIIEI
jgi:hypothetical protein